MRENFEVDLEDLIYRPDTFGTIRAIGIEKYPGEMPIARELIQNADDVGAPLIRFKMNEDEIVIENNGRSFSKPDEVDKKEESDFYRVSHIGLGKTEEEMTGTFGIGFTSVFHITDNPRIVSNGWNFEIRVNDYPSIKPSPPSRITRLHLPLRLSETKLSKKIRAELFGQKKLEMFERQLIYEAYKDVFFLKKLRKIEAYKNGVKLFSVARAISHVETITKNLSREFVTIRITSIKEGRKKSHTEKWTVYSLKEIEIPKDLAPLGQTLKQEVSIAIPLNFKGTRTTKRFIDQNHAHHRLPVMLTGFNFKYNASKFYTTSGRNEFVAKEGLKRDWNLWQIDNLAELLSFTIEDLISREINPRIIYQFVPMSTQVRHLFDEHLLNSLKAKIESREVKLFYTSRGIWKEKGKIHMNWDGLHEVLPVDSGRYLIHPSLKRYTEVFKSYGINKIGLEEFVDYLEEKYGTSTYESKEPENPNKIRKIFEYLGRKKRMESCLIERLRKICILLTEENVLRSCEYRVYFPTDKKMPLINKGDIIHHLTYKTRASRNFLEKKLRIKKMSLHYLILDSFLPRVKQYDDRKKFEFVSYLVRRQRDVFRKRSTVQELTTHVKDVIVMENLNDPDGPIFFPDPELKEVFEDKLNYVSPRYKQRKKRENVKWRRFLKKIGVEETPPPKKIIAVTQEMESVGYRSKTVRKSRSLLKFLDEYWRKYYSKHAEDLKEIREHRWIPTNRKRLENPTNVYAFKKVEKLVGESKNFPIIRIPRNKGLVRVLGLLIEARLDDVIEFILEKRGEEKGEKDRPVGLRVYSYLNRRIETLDPNQLKTLKQNRTIWFRNRLWKPRKLYLKNYQSKFGPNGWLRGYIRSGKLSKFHRLCQVLDIDRTPTLDDYLEWLSDIADELGEETPKRWQVELVRRTYSELAPTINLISENRLEEIRNKKVTLTSEPRLRLPHECFLLRRGEEPIYERILKAGISVPIVKVENAENEKLHLRFGVNEITYSLSTKRADENPAHLDRVLTERFQRFLPWLDGFEFSSTGELSEHNLMFQRLEVYRVSKLKVLYILKGREITYEGNPIADICSYEENDKGTIYLDDSFQLQENDHLHLLSLNLVKNLNPAIDKVRWSLAIPSLLVLGQIIGISPYDRRVQKPEETFKTMPPIPERVKGVRTKKPAEFLETKEGLTETDEIAAQDLIGELDRVRVEANKAFQGEAEKSLDFTKMPARKRKRFSTITSKSSVIYTIESKRIAAKNWKRTVIDGEEVYVDKNVPLPPLDRIRNLRELTRKIVETMGFDSASINICIAKTVTDGYNKEGQLFFNAVREDSPFRWFGVVARELAYNYSHRHYPHVNAMVYLIKKGLENIVEIFPELFDTKGVL